MCNPCQVQAKNLRVCQSIVVRVPTPNSAVVRAVLKIPEYMGLSRHQMVAPLSILPPTIFSLHLYLCSVPIFHIALIQTDVSFHEGSTKRLRLQSHKIF